MPPISKAFMLAAGLGTRLRPLTDEVPKCLIPIHGAPLLSIWMDLCEQLGIAEVLINTHHLAAKVNDWASAQNTRVRITLAHEEVLLGSAGTVAANRRFVEREETFWVFYADNLVHLDFAALQVFHGEHSGAMTVALFRSPAPQNCGVVTLDPSGRIIGFEEKPARPVSNLVNAGIYLCRRSIFDFLPTEGFADFGRDIMPKLAGRIWGIPLDGYILDIGTPENYNKAIQEWPLIRRSAVSKQGNLEAST